MRGFELSNALADVRHAVTGSARPGRRRSGCKKLFGQRWDLMSSMSIDEVGRELGITLEEPMRAAA